MEDKKSLTYSLFNDDPVQIYNFSDNEKADRSNYTNKGVMQPEIVIEWAEELYKQVVKNHYDIYINRVFLSGNLSAYYFKLNKFTKHNIIDNKGYDSVGLQMKGWNTIDPNASMANVFSGYESLRKSMK